MERRRRGVPPPPRGRGEDGIVVGMSGGVDSAVAAERLHEAGWRVVGVTLRLFCYARREESKRPCCTAASIADARRLCAELGVEHRVVDASKDFEAAVIDEFLSEYARGRTPNPCVACNERVKLPGLLRVADWLGFRRIATGHYARIVRGPAGRPFLARAADATKDQSYFLYRTPVAILERILFPVGESRKDEVRREAAAAGYRRAAPRESQDVCFIPRGDLRSFIAGLIRCRPGEIVDSAGAVVGRHAGACFYTIGQRKGLGIAGGVPLYVKRIDADANRVVIAPEGELWAAGAVCMRLKMRVRGLEGQIEAKIRHRQTPAAVSELEREGGRLVVRFRERQRAITPGQSLVLYRDGLVIGGGIIAEALGGGAV